MILEEKGSSASGNYGHAGVRGHLGGSAPRGGKGGGGKKVNVISSKDAGKGNYDWSSASKSLLVSGVGSTSFQESSFDIGPGSTKGYVQIGGVQKSKYRSPYGPPPSGESLASFLSGKKKMLLYPQGGNVLLDVKIKKVGMDGKYVGVSYNEKFNSNDKKSK